MKNTNFSAFGALIIIFFFWGFVASSNDILIPVFKKALDLKQDKAQWISVAFYIAYTVGSLIYFAISALLRKDLLKILGYRNGLALGLVISALGTLLFIPAANNASFGLLLGGLFTVGIGFALQQIAANPLAINMGDPSTGNLRLSLAGGRLRADLCLTKWPFPFGNVRCGGSVRACVVKLIELCNEVMRVF